MRQTSRRGSFADLGNPENAASPPRGMCQHFFLLPTMTSLQDIPISTIMEQMVYPDRQNMVGKRFKIAFLRSDKGKELNGQFCQVVGFERDTVDIRLKCRLEDSEETVKLLKYSNLVPEEVSALLEKYMEHSAPLSDATLAGCLERALEKHNGTTDQEDYAHRLEHYRNLLQKMESSESSSTDLDYCFPCGAGAELLPVDSIGVALKVMKPACCGDGNFDIRFVDRGLKGDDREECTICLEVLAADSDEALVTLPCLHIFHEKCIVRCLESDTGRQNWNCPTCRRVVPEDMSTYRVNYDTHLQCRIDEYPLSGFCTKCQLWIMERNRNEELPGTFE